MNEQNGRETWRLRDETRGGVLAYLRLAYIAVCNSRVICVSWG